MDDPNSLSAEASGGSPVRPMGAGPALPVLAPVPVLPYRQGEAGPSVRRPGAGLFMLLMLPALAIPFLPLLVRRSPMGALFDAFFDDGNDFLRLRWIMALLAAPFLLAFPLIFWKIRLTVPVSTSRKLRVALWITGGALSTPVLGIGVYVLQVIGKEGYQSGMWVVPVGILLMAGIWGIAFFLAYRSRREHGATMALYAGFLGNSFMCVGIGWDELRAGHVVACYVMIVMIVDVIGALVASKTRDAE